MQIDDALIDKLALLSRLRFTATEKESIRHDLEKMISFVDKLNELDTEGVAPLLHVSRKENVMREDIVSQKITREEALKNAYNKDDQFFKVPKVIKK